MFDVITVTDIRASGPLRTPHKRVAAAKTSGGTKGIVLRRGLARYETCCSYEVKRRSRMKIS
jgi:hypothetical protein